MINKNMFTAKEKAIHLLSEATKRSNYLSPSLKLIEAKETVFEQLKVAREFIYVTVMIEELDKGIRKTLDYLDTVKKEVENL